MFHGAHTNERLGISGRIFDNEGRVISVYW